MNPQNLTVARQLRDAGIDAMAAVNFGLSEVMGSLSAQEQGELQLAVGRLMGAIADALIDPAVQVFPELKPDRDTWMSVAAERAAARSKAQ